jgi:hypothetical protein
MSTIRERLLAALAGDRVGVPVYAVYDWFVKNRRIDWPCLFAKGLGVIGHASLLRVEYPNAAIVQTISTDAGGERRDVRWTTDIGELHEWYRGEWRQEYLVKSPADYRVLARALEGARFTAADEAFDASEILIGPRGVTMGQLCEATFECRTPLQAIQIDCAGLERFSLDLASSEPALMDLVDLMNEHMLEKFRLVRGSRAVMIKLWENLSIETMGPGFYKRLLVPLYRQLSAILEGTGKEIHVHYDGRLRPIAEEIAGLAFSGIDSLTGPPEGDLSAAEARSLWPRIFLWLHPNLGWYSLPADTLKTRLRAMARGAGGRFCMMISEEVPPSWEQTVPLVLGELDRLGGAA